ncbi:MAG: nucleotidyltransferase domain-containing protein [Candidatus Melainabacteria bacterium HGW-Melainabacteria-1]|nr:MAG: nucleotidyltransferase domain-containing protein [Candidatus Melainabacteria bacterium HGW-Melainabacteria-1]
MAAFLAGSVVRNEATVTSDLDLVIVTEHDPAAPYRRSLMRGGWPVELFVHTQASLRRFFASDIQHGTPSLPQMCAEGLIVCQSDGQADVIKAEAQALLKAGPEPLSAEQAMHMRYHISDLLEDLRGSLRPEESLFIAPLLAENCIQFHLAMNGFWQGKGKWAHRALKRVDAMLAQRLVNALQAVYCDRLTLPLITVVEELLAPHGGPLFAGYYSQAPKPAKDEGS